jgi:hypothetical protein
MVCEKVFVIAVLPTSAPFDLKVRRDILVAP